MINKLYEKTKIFIKENIKFLLAITLIFFLSIFKLPFYVDGPGGLINVNDKITIQNGEKINGSINLSYVTEIKATIPVYLFALLHKDYDIVKIEEMKYDNETIKEALFRSDLLLDESIKNATYVAYKKANKNINIINNKIYITHVQDKNTTDLKIGDQILKINDTNIENKEQLYNSLSNYKENETINITVLNNNKEYIRTAKLKKIEDRVVIGILITEIFDLEVEPNIKYNFDDSETGPSGGLMLSLAIYDYLSKEDLTKGKTIVGTGTIDKNGLVGQIGGVKYKLKGAIKNKADIFIVPAGDNYNEVIKLVEENNYNIKIIKATTFDEVIEQLKNS